MSNIRCSGYSGSLNYSTPVPLHGPSSPAVTAVSRVMVWDLEEQQEVDGELGGQQRTKHLLYNYFSWLQTDCKAFCYCTVCFSSEQPKRISSVLGTIEFFEHKVSSGGWLVQSPCTRMVSQSRLSRTVSSWVLNVSSDGDSRASLGNLCQCLTFLTVKKSFLVFKYSLLHFSLCSLLLVCHRKSLRSAWLCLLYLLPLGYYSSCYSSSYFSILRLVKIFCTYKNGQHTLGSLWSEIWP